MRLVDDEHAVAVTRGLELRHVAQLADVVHARVRRGVDLRRVEPRESHRLWRERERPAVTAQEAGLVGERVRREIAGSAVKPKYLSTMSRSSCVSRGTTEQIEIPVIAEKNEERGAAVAREIP